MQNQFSRMALLVGEDAIERLSRARVAVLVWEASAATSWRHWRAAASEHWI